MSTEPENPGMPRDEDECDEYRAAIPDKPFLVKVQRIQTATIELHAKDWESASRGALNDVSDEDYETQKVHVASIEMLDG